MMFPKPEKVEKKRKPPKKNVKPIKQKSPKLGKLERQRKPLTNGRCWVTGTTIDLDKHEIFGGANRQISMKWGMVIELSRKWHDLAKLDEFVRLFFQKWGQRQFEKMYPEEDFVKIFGTNYLAKPYKGACNEQFMSYIYESGIEVEEEDLGENREQFNRVFKIQSQSDKSGVKSKGSEDGPYSWAIYQND